MKKEQLSQIIKNTTHLIDIWLPIKIRYDKTPGLSIGIMYKGNLVYARGFGYTDLEKKIPVNEKTLYHIASISKTFTSVAIIQLVEKGKLCLDDKVADYIPWFRAKSKNINSKNITIRQILSHTAGLFRDGDTPHWETGDFPTDLKKSFGISSLTFENGTRFKYTNYGFSLLGLIIKKISGLTYKDYIEKNILKPLQMNSTTVDYSKSLKNVATGYGREMPDKDEEVFEHYKTNAYAPATGFLSNVSDLAKHLSALSLESKKSLINRESKKEIMKGHEKTEGNDEYGLGFDIIRITKRKIIGHGGGYFGFITRIFLDPALDLGVIVLTNSQSSEGSGIGRGVFEMIYNGLDNLTKHEGKLPVYSKYEGIYRNRWEDSVVAQFGKELLEFYPATNSPIKFATILEKGKSQDSFIMKTNNVFASPGEMTVFKDFKSGKAQLCVASSTPSKRIIINQ